MTSTRRLYLLRHAQAAAAPVGGRDYDRPLDRQGEADARALARTLAATGFAPGLVMCSGAARTRGTLACLEPLVAKAQIRFDDALYEDREDAYRTAATASETHDILIIGHNPTIAALARSLAHSPASGRDGGGADRLARGFPTCALATFTLQDPSDLGSARLEELSIPPHRTR